MKHTKRYSSKLSAFSVLIATLLALVIAGVLAPVGDQKAEALPINPAMATGSSPDNWISVEVVANPTTVPLGGGNVTFTYRVTNTKPASYPSYPDYRQDWMFFDKIHSNVCNNAQPTAASQLKYYPSTREYYLRAGETAEWTCTTNITQATNNTFTATFYDYYGNYYNRRSIASATEPVTMQTGTGYTCDALWYSSGKGSGISYGHLGTIDLTSGYALTNRFTINFKTTAVDVRNGSSSPNTTMVGSAAVAVDPLDPNKIYYFPRDSSYWNYGGTYVYDAQTGTNTFAASQGTVHAVVRLGFSADGKAWLVDYKGDLYRLDGTSWTKLGQITLGNLPGDNTLRTFNTGGSGVKLYSGDLAFDGLGNMWIIGSDNGGTAYLYTISKEELTGGQPINATMVGDMGNGEFNGIAFGPDGKLYATDDNDVAGLFEVNKTTGEATRITYLTEYVEDLGSCALPKPVLNITKEAEPSDGVLPNGTITYTVKIENTGNLEATGVTFRDDLTGQYMTYVQGSTKMNGATWADVNGTAPFNGTAALVKSPSARHLGTVAAGETVTITFQVKPVAGQTEVCNSGTVDFTGNPQAGGILTDDPRLPNPTDPTCVPIYHPAVGIDKKGLDPDTGDPKTLATPGDDTVRYVYYVSTDPNQPKGMAAERDENGLLVEGPKPGAEARLGNEPLSNVVVTDDRCTNVVPIETTEGGASYNVGDRNYDGLLDPDEIWEFECTQTVSTAEDTTNTATVNATSTKSNTPLQNTDTWTVEGRQALLTLVKKIADPVYDPDANVNQWTLSATGGEGFPSDIIGKTDESTITNRVLPAGTYTLAEQLDSENQYKQTGYVMDSLECLDIASATPSQPLDLGTGDQLELAYGQDVVCTFTNSTLPASLTWAKVDADNTAQTLVGSEWTLTGPSYPEGTTIGATFENNGTFTVDNLMWGNYTLTELKAPAGYVRDVTDWSAVLGPDPATGTAEFDVDLGNFPNAKIVPPNLPLTGGISRDFYTILGGIVAALGLGWVALNRRQITRKEAL
ncbi:MAG: SpaA isopeptide-forming pilin-related protein [Arcanobacterium sp.]